MSNPQRRASFEARARPLIEPLRRYLQRRTDHETADDALADTLLVLWRRFEEVPEDPESALAWSYTVARNCLANAERGARRQRRLAARVARVDPPADATETTPTNPDLAEALAALPATQAEVLRLWAWEELGASEIAQVLDITPNAASIRLHRARENLKVVLQRGKIEGSAGHVGVVSEHQEGESDG